MISKNMTVLLPYIWGFFLWFFFLFFQAQGIWGGDSGDLVTAAYLGGVPHPPGYPLYTALGFIVSHIPTSTVAWRMGLLSSLPHAAAATLVFLLVWKITRKVVPGLFASLVLVGNYLFFLYSVTPEVFALFDLFLIGLTYLVYQKRYFWASLVFGLGLSHHHVILFFIPALFYWMFKVKKFTIYYVLFTIGGLFPYLYIPIAARGDAIINWDRAVDLSSFIRLVTRADYGSFVSSGFYGSQLVERIIQVKTYIQFLVLDVHWIGIGLAALGWYWLWRRERNFAVGVALALFFLGPVFYFYASFPIVNRFTLGTYERFLLPTYLFLAILIGLGMEQVVQFSIWRKPLVQFLFVTMLFLYPLTSLGMTTWRFWGLQTDRTAEFLAKDILTSVPQDAILLMQRDTPLFSTQYTRYVLGIRPDITLIHTSRLPSSDYPGVLATVFPELSIPGVRGEMFVREFLKENSEKFTITSITRAPAPAGWFWVPHGLVFLLTREQNLPSARELVVTSDTLWAQFHDPGSGLLSRYNHLMLADVRDVYATGRIELGKTLMRAGMFVEAKHQFESAIALEGDTQVADSYMYFGLTEFALDRCDSALSAFQTAREKNLTPDPNLILFESQTYRDCVGDSSRADELLRQFEALKTELETPLSP